MCVAVWYYRIVLPLEPSQVLGIETYNYSSDISPEILRLTLEEPLPRLQYPKCLFSDSVFARV